VCECTDELNFLANITNTWIHSCKQR
jgi:hypothetical protein